METNLKTPNTTTDTPVNSPSEKYVVEIKHLKKSFGHLEVLRDINLNLRKGENLVILGKSGSGKSVLIKCLVQLIQPDEGQLTI